MRSKNVYPLLIACGIGLFGVVVMLQNKHYEEERELAIRLRRVCTRHLHLELKERAAYEDRSNQ